MTGEPLPPRLCAWSDLLAWRSHLRARRDTAAHDVFTPGGLGHHVARVYQLIMNEPASPRHLANVLGYPLARTLQLLDHLAAAGLARSDRRGWWHPGRTTPDRAAELLGVAGILDARAARY